MEALPVRRVVVTGGASGIGQACCRALTQDGWQVVILDANAQEAEKYAAEIGAAWYATDVSDDLAMQATAATIEATLGPVTALVNSAGIVQHPRPPEKLPMAEYDRVVAIDQRGTYVSCVAFGQHMARRGHGAIVSVASIVGMRSVPLHAYAPAKAAVIAMTECLAGEWGPAGVRVNCVSPGYTLTKRVAAQIEMGERDAELLKRNAALQRLVHPEEVADAVMFLLSERASAITGVNLPVDCGWLLAPSWSTYGGLRPKTDNQPLSSALSR